MNRREFLKAGAAAGVALSTFNAYVAGAADQKPFRVGVIGPGWYGKMDLFRLMQVAPCEVVSLADPDRRMLSEAAEMVAARQPSKKQPRTYTDYRQMLKERDLDIVIVATPDHWHALPTIAACEAGAHVYVQKPISVDVMEGKAMLDAARKHNRVVQVGTQRRSTPHLIEARDEYIRSGRLGKIAHVEMCCHFASRGGPGKPQEIPVPEYLDWEMWTGPAPMRPYVRGVHPRGWRSYMEYCNGTIGDMGIHMLDMVRWMLGLGWPKRISASGGMLVQADWPANRPDTHTAIFDFGSLSAVWNHRTWGPPADPDYPWAATFYGENGILKASVTSYTFIPNDRRAERITRRYLDERDKYPEDVNERDIELFAVPGTRRHMKDMVDAINSGGRPVADIEEGHISSACCIMANLSLQLGRGFTWDPQKHEVVGDAEATRLLRRPYRLPWVHPAA